VPRREHTSKAFRYGTRFQGSYLHNPLTERAIPAWSWYSFTDPGGMEGWVDP